jgi:uncharacterized protein YjbJ (UPF0337 family)
LSYTLSRLAKPDFDNARKLFFLKITGTVKTKWSKLTDDDLKAIGGKRDHLAGAFFDA